MIRDRMRLSPVGPEFPPGTDGLATLDRDDLHPLQAEAIRRMSPERRWQQVVAAIEMARRIREGERLGLLRRQDDSRQRPARSCGAPRICGPSEARLLSGGRVREAPRSEE